LSKEAGWKENYDQVAWLVADIYPWAREQSFENENQLRRSFVPKINKGGKQQIAWAAQLFTNSNFITTFQRE
jgi:hypothetical protein